MYDVIIIGGGFAGLSAVALLARRGARVILFEQAAGLGGRAGYHERDGYVWQYGQHSHRLADDGLAAEVFRRLGERLDFIDTRGDRAYLYADGRLHRRPEGPAQFLFTELMPFKSRLVFLRFLGRLLRQRPEDWYDRTLLDMYRTWHGDKGVERFLAFLGFTIMLPDPGAVSAGEVIQFMRRAMRARVKQGEPRGGSKQVIDKLEQITLRAGGEIRRDERVRQIMIEGGIAKGIGTDRDAYMGRRVVYAAPLPGLFDVVEPGLFSADWVGYVNGLEPSRGISIDFVTDGPVSDIRGGILGLDEPLWVKFQSNLDSSIAPKGKHVCTWAMLLERGVTADPEQVGKREKRLRAIIDEVMPELPKRVVEERRLVIPVVNANILKPEQSYPHRPGVVSKDVEGLYFIGDTTQGLGCSGDIAFSSAMRLMDEIKLDA